MLQLMEVTNMHETTPAVSTAEHNIAPLINEIFNSVEAGEIPTFPPLMSSTIMRNQKGETLLIAAARRGHAAVVDRLRNEIDADETDNEGWTALLVSRLEATVATRVLMAATR